MNKDNLANYLPRLTRENVVGFAAILSLVLAGCSRAASAETQDVCAGVPDATSTLVWDGSHDLAWFVLDKAYGGQTELAKHSCSPVVAVKRGGNCVVFQNSDLFDGRRTAAEVVKPFERVHYGKDPVKVRSNCSR